MRTTGKKEKGKSKIRKLKSPIAAAVLISLIGQTISVSAGWHVHRNIWTLEQDQRALENIGTPSNAQSVRWQVHFADQMTHQIKLADLRQGEIQEGGLLTVNYRSRLVDDSGCVWKAVKEPPLHISVHGPGDQIYYIEYCQDGFLSEGEDFFEKEKSKLSQWLRTAKEQEALITGEEVENIPDSRMMASSQAENDERLLTAAGHLGNEKEQIVYLIGKNMAPNGIILKKYDQGEITYSNFTEDTMSIEDDVYVLARFAIARDYNKERCMHRWIERMNAAPTCLENGTVRYLCEMCGMEEKVTWMAAGHVDSDSDSICEQCRKRAFQQKQGSTIQASVAVEGNQKRHLTFVCVDEDYQGGMLYVSKEEIPVTDFGGYGNLTYLLSNPARYFQTGWQNGFSIAGDPLMAMTVEGITGYAAILSWEEAETYQEYLDGSYLTRTRMEDGLVMLTEHGLAEKAVPEHGTCGIRPAILLRKPDAGEAEKTHWNVGDVQAGEIDGNTYLFRCIDQNYAGQTESHRQSALFLCDAVIPANQGSSYRFEQSSDGLYRYVFKPGPIVNFGESNEYKYSKIRKWLRKAGERFFNAEEISTGTLYAYTGSTEAGGYRQLKESGLKASYIGSQHMTDRLFILSVDEALKYKHWLWRFGGSHEENPETQYGPFQKGYWLRNPVGTKEDYHTGLAYMVDLVNGNIHPAAVTAGSSTDDEEMNQTCTIGVRPAFVMPQD